MNCWLLQTVADREKDDSYRHSALEVMVSLCENAAGMVKKKAAQFIPPLLEQCLSLMTELDDNTEEWLNCDNADDENGEDLMTELDDNTEEWLNCDNADDENGEDSAGIGESSLDRIACSLGGFVLDPFLPTVLRLMQDVSNWKNRYAAIMAISTIGEGCKRQMEPIIVKIVNDILRYLVDPHPRVRYAACNALGQISTDFAPTMQKKCHEKVVNGLCGLMIDLRCPRVAAHAGAALVNFSEDCPKSIITIYLQQMMENLEFVLEHTFKQVFFLLAFGLVQ
ncbi:unnamed protein product [Gongylonema pulchrum]|uniref:TOG domain-containing protein n=1 Tax=Gongylonema pulchrum TaxID=637853 RepID=A0A183DQR9_9BILA|nr:unnamed protein product [Gongylonema pulchrum]